MENKKQFIYPELNIVAMKDIDIITTSGEKPKLTDILFGEGKGGVNVA